MYPAAATQFGMGIMQVKNPLAATAWAAGAYERGSQLPPGRIINPTVGAVFLGVKA